MFARIPFGTSAFILAVVLASTPTPAQDKRQDACGGAIDCDCENIAGAGILTPTYKQDCRTCEGKILAHCRSASQQSDSLSAIADALSKVGYCQNICSVIGPNPRPVPRAQNADADADVPPPLRPMRLLCGRNERFVHDARGGAQATGCLKGGRRHGLWIVGDADGRTTYEVYYVDGREMWRRERRRG